MGRAVRDTRLDTREARLRLAVRKEPYWRLISEGAHLGYYRGERVGKWVARFRKTGGSGGYLKATLGEADDIRNADGESILTFKQADEAARLWFEAKVRGDRKAGPYTVGDALDDYLANFDRKSLDGTRLRIEALIRPALGEVDANALTTKQISDWHRARAATAARLRTGKRREQQLRPLDDDESKRRRKSTANRDLTVLKAALNEAYRKGKIRSDEAWRKVKPFAKVEGVKLRYLSDDEVRRLVNAVDVDIRPLVQAALLTGARYGELGAIKVQDVDLSAGTVWMMDTKAGKPRVAYLESEGLSLFTQASAGKKGHEIVFSRPDGQPWKSSQQGRRLRDACVKANISPPAGFHDLRRTYGARLAVRGVPMAVIAEALGHADDRVTRRHYAHLAPSYVADTVRAHAAGLGIVEASNLVKLTAEPNKTVAG